MEVSFIRNILNYNLKKCFILDEQIQQQHINKLSINGCYSMQFVFEAGKNKHNLIEQSGKWLVRMPHTKLYQ